MAKENSKIIYRGDWAREERAIMEANNTHQTMINDALLSNSSRSGSILHCKGIVQSDRVSLF